MKYLARNIHVFRFVKMEGVELCGYSPLFLGFDGVAEAYISTSSGTEASIAQKRAFELKYNKSINL